jgi:hypothetical protein
MMRVWAELRRPITVLVLIGVVMRVLAPLPALAALRDVQVAAMLRATLCLPSGEVPDGLADHPLAGEACPLCRLPDALCPPPPQAVLPAPVTVGEAIGFVHVEQAAPCIPPFHGPPPARAPPAAPTYG